MPWRYHTGCFEASEGWGFLYYFCFISIYFIRIVTWRLFLGSQLFWSLVLETPWIFGSAPPFFPSPPFTLLPNLFKIPESTCVKLVWDQNRVRWYLAAFLAILHPDVIHQMHLLFEPSQRSCPTDFLWSSIYSALPKQQIQAVQSPVHQIPFWVAWLFGNKTFEWMVWKILLQETFLSSIALWWHCL